MRGAEGQSGRVAKWQSGKWQSGKLRYLQPCNLQPCNLQPCPMKPNISIIGVGAMACLFAARLHGLAEFYLVGHWPEQIATLRGRGLTLLPMNDHLGHNEHAPSNNGSHNRVCRR